ncbi:MAG: tRNA (adenosine(37)-N6)-dimethylallyltransferase MiaA [Bacteroidales bacterium]
MVAGPTAIGKTGVTIKLARHFGTSIISADSRQFFREMKIGTAAPAAEELSAAPHFLVGHLSVEDSYNVSQFEQDVLAILEREFQHHPLVFLTGGSGLYIDAVCKGIDDLPDPDEGLRRRIRGWHRDLGIGYLQEKLKNLDPEYFRQVDKANPNRLMRAIEVCLLTGQTYSSLRTNKKRERDFNIIKIGLNRPRNELFEQIGRRTHQMIADDLVEEVKSLAKFRNLNALNSVGYKEIFEYLDGSVPLEQAVENIKTNTRRYAKRQLTWFRRDEEIEWFLPEEIRRMTEFIGRRTASPAEEKGSG